MLKNPFMFQILTWLKKQQQLARGNQLAMKKAWCVGRTPQANLIASFEKHTFA